ncbi:MAG TPA: RNA-binding protein [Vicinamibacterales bacterium]|nr:RNA-binding protein [Vicinamibacterales bacterium]
MAVRLFVGNLAYSTTEADLRAYFGTIAPPSQVVLPVDRETGRPRGFAFVEFLERGHAEAAIQKFNGQMFNGRPLAVSEARAREDRGPSGPRPGGPRPGGGGFGGPRPGGFGGPRPGGTGGFGGPKFDPAAPTPPRNRNFGPDAKPQRGQNAKAKKKETERPRGPIPMKTTGRSFTLDDVDDFEGEELPDIDDIATSRPAKEEDEE